MVDISIHNVVSIHTSLDDGRKWPTWRNFIVTDSEGKQFQITLFGKPEHLKIKEENHG